MEFIFDENEIKFDGLTIKYDEFKKDDANKLLYKMMIKCVNCEDELVFTATDKCTPFGKKLKEIIEEEFNKNVNVN